jgi:hypothetical protein
MTPMDADPTARAGSSSSGSGSSERVSPRADGTGIGLDAPTVATAGRARAVAFQGAAVDSALEELGALPSLLGPDGPFSSSDGARGRVRSVERRSGQPA